MDLAEINVGDKILDPSCAIGQFLGPIVDKLILKVKKQGLQDKELVKVITQDVYGTDINKRFVKLCKKYLTEKNYRPSELKAKFKISKKDFLSEDCETKFQEHLTVVKNKVAVKKNEELYSGILQSPDDIDATYRKKGKKDGWGQSVNVTETANPENELNLITDIALEPNNMEDREILNGRIESLKEKTP